MKSLANTKQPCPNMRMHLLFAWINLVQLTLKWPTHFTTWVLSMKRGKNSNLHFRNTNNPWILSAGNWIQSICLLLNHSIALQMCTLRWEVAMQYPTTKKHLVFKRRNWGRLVQRLQKHLSALLLFTKNRESTIRQFPFQKRPWIFIVEVCTMMKTTLWLPESQILSMIVLTNKRGWKTGLKTTAMGHLEQWKVSQVCCLFLPTICCKKKKLKTND
mmetsp:Transcript_7170/g.20046  ORF Transcript_7170/g.20046 Transcript_7170/m.20046 type:complete len:216 (-) Transcript_7170:266-913(-)